MRRRTDLPAAALERLAEADALRGLRLDRRQALWAVKGVPDKILPLFAAADSRWNQPLPEAEEPAVVLVPMHEGGEVVEDYLTTGLSLRRHPVAFLREELQERRMITCAELDHVRDGRRVVVPGLVLVRQRPGSAKGVMFVTVEDETGFANLVVWPTLFERQRPLLLGARMIACQGRVQRDGSVVHVVARDLLDLSALLRTVGEQDEGTMPDGSGPEMGIKVPTRDFR